MLSVEVWVVTKMVHQGMAVRKNDVELFFNKRSRS